MKTDVLNEFFRRSRGWPSAAQGQELFSAVADFFSDITDLDSGFLLYPKRDTSEGGFFDELAIYEPWGVFKGKENELEESCEWASSEFETLTPAMEQWFTPEDLPTNLRGLLNPFGLSEVGIWPIHVHDTLNGRIVVGRAKPSSSLLPKETCSVLMNAVSSQLSMALNLIRAARMAEAASQRDPLTGLLNRRGLEANLSSMMERAEEKGSVLGFGLIDLNGLKTINDTHGHPMGDEVLKTVASIIRQSVREDDLVARYGGDEFAVVLEMEHPDVEAIMRRIQEAVEKWSRGYSVSVGGALLGTDGDLERCYHVADQRLYEVKRTTKMDPE